MCPTCCQWYVVVYEFGYYHAARFLAPLAQRITRPLDRPYLLPPSVIPTRCSVWPMVYPRLPLGAGAGVGLSASGAPAGR